MSLLGIHFHHDTSFGFSPYPGEYRIYELERLTRVRHDSLDCTELKAIKYTPKITEEIFIELRNQIEKEYGKEALKIEKVFLDQMHFEVAKITAGSEIEGEGIYDNIFRLLSKYFDLPGEENFISLDHHLCHAYSAFFQSPFDEAIVISLDGGGRKANREDFNFFAGYIIDRTGEHLEIFDHDWTGCSTYSHIPLLCDFINERSDLPVAGKAMGAGGYSGPDFHFVKQLEELLEIKYFYTMTNADKKAAKEGKSRLIIDDPDGYWNELISSKYEINEDGRIKNFFAGAQMIHSYQIAFENYLIKILTPMVKKYNLPIVFTGGAALNVLFNTRLKREFNLPVFIPCNPNDTGTAIGGIFKERIPEERVDMRFNNWDLFDRDDLQYFVETHNAKQTNIEEIANLIREGKLIGVVKGRSECGPRALGNRSIICDASIEGMKNILNSKVKFREWYRPFAPMVLKEDSEIYFNWDNSDAPHMSFSSIVNWKYRKQLSSVKHWDHTARIQTVTEEDNKWYYLLLNELKKTGLPVLLNTSFNTKGFPILNTIEEALNILQTTELDYVIVEDYLFSKQ